MHAASVHPEPGSNSRANCIWTVTGLNLVCRACLALYTLLSMSRIRDRFEILFSKKFRDSFASSFCLYFNLLLFNCQWSARIPPLFQRRVFRDLFIIPHLFPFVKRFLKSFSKIFAVFFCFQLAAVFVAARCQLAYYSTFVFICQAVFDNFFQFGDDSSMS